MHLPVKHANGAMRTLFMADVAIFICIRWFETFKHFNSCFTLTEWFRGGTRLLSHVQTAHTEEVVSVVHMCENTCSFNSQHRFVLDCSER